MSGATEAFYVRSNGALVNATVRERLLFGVVVDTDTECWNWQRGSTDDGYGVINIRALGTDTAVHRVAWGEFVGPIPEGMTVDHLCFNTLCINPHHLRLLTPSENSKHKLSLARTACKRGHALTPPNLSKEKGRRRCLRCQRDLRRAREATRRQEAAS